MANSKRQTEDQQIKKLKALCNPHRVEILNVIARGKVSPNWIAKELNVGLGRAAYSVKVLLDAGLIKKAGTKSVRGATEHFYRLALPEDGPLRCFLLTLDSMGCEEVSEVLDESISAINLAHERSKKRLSRDDAPGKATAMVVASLLPRKG